MGLTFLVLYICMILEYSQLLLGITLSLFHGYKQQHCDVDMSDITKDLYMHASVVDVLMAQACNIKYCYGFIDRHESIWMDEWKGRWMNGLMAG